MAYETKVIKILDELRVIIRGGWNDGINKGDQFNIVERGEVIIDPETNENLGTLDFVKIRLEVVRVYEEFSVLSNMVTKRIPSATQNAMLSIMATVGQEKKVTSAEKIPVDESEITPPLVSESDKNVHVGDIAVKFGI
ncbi:FlgT C-terminal domain-containing protein [Weissella confusa]|uniref:FlgT C-terminal domain-containing protein n=1 Tax=Weissella confusa TaxID=1583 RepID=UPI00280BB81B|nr:FlgT C-terminal domain-containing protein [Weissella confusa]